MFFMAMNRIPSPVIFFLLLCVSFSAQADWTRIDANDEFTSFANYDSIKRQGDLVKMWTMRDYKQIKKSTSGELYQSEQAQIEADCREEKFRLLSLTLYSAARGGGRMVQHDEKMMHVWAAPAPGTVGEKIWKIACRKH
jgi:hypothetical protein